MISIIICSRDSAAATQASKNILDTIGVEHEIIVIDNSKRAYGICEAYNLGAERSKYNLLCFMHEDLKMHTQNWGKIVAAILADASIGLVGVAGSTYLLNSPSAWWHAGSRNVYINIIHTSATQEKELMHKNPDSAQLPDVAVIDGVWMCTRKEVWEKSPFDTKILDEFHYYDLDYSLRVRNNAYRVCVTFDVLIEHFSLGTINASWVKNTLRFYKKYEAQLPFGISAHSAADNQATELQLLGHFISLLVKNKFPLKIIAKYLSHWVRLKARL
ncbi:MAG: hypothetical protein EOO60_07545 [Hymenobacter sp.]|nr:MAG: hypothetical protein EOO60_07545 [Hymenobacter sp.]